MDDTRTGYFFNSEAFIEHREHPPIITFANGSVSLKLTHTEEGLVSPWRATFGGFDHSEDCNKHDLDLLLGEMESWGKEKNIREITIAPPPLVYEPAFARMLYVALLDKSFACKTVDWNYHIEVSNSEYKSMLHPSLRRRLKKCEKAGFRFRELSAQEKDPEAIHTFVKKAREAKGYALNMDVSAFESAFEKLGEDYPVFVVEQGKNLICLGVCVRAHAQGLYLIFPADDPAYLQYSPSVLLHAGIYGYCQKENIPIFDLGTGSMLERGVPNYGLMTFKKRLGAVVSPKLTFEKSFGL